MSIEQLIADHTAALNENTEQLKILNAGRAEALAAVDRVAAAAGESAPKRGRKKAEAEPAPAAGAEPAAGAAAEPAPAAAEPSSSTVSVEEQLRAATAGYVDAEGLTAEQKAARIENIKAIMSHFGGMLCGPQSKLDDQQRAQALFYVKRYAAGCTVNFSQEYDFAGDPAQGGLEETAAADDEFDIG
jgi:hypothetical protein